MNFDWLKEYIETGGCPWSDDHFYKHGLSDAEVLYAWALTEAYRDIMDDIEEYCLNQSQGFWQVNSYIFKLENNKIIVSSPYNDIKYSLAVNEFTEHVNYFLESKEKSL